MTLTTRRIVLGATLALLGGCAWRVQTEPPPSPPSRPTTVAPPASGWSQPPMSYDEALALGSRYAESRSLAYRIKDADLDRKRIWKLKFDVWRRHARGHLRLEYDAYSRALLRAEEKISDKRDRDGDDDDDRRREGRRKRGDD